MSASSPSASSPFVALGTNARFALRAGLLALLLAGCGGGGDGDGNGGGTDDPPTASFTGPASNVAVLPGDALDVQVTTDDDGSAPVQIVADLDGVFATTGDQVVLQNGFDSNGASVDLAVATAALTPGSYTLFVVVDDGVNAPAVDAAPGQLVVHQGLAGVPPPRSNTYGVTGNHVAFAVGELAQGGGASLNPPDADLGDAVVAVVDATTGIVVQGTIDADVTGLDVGGTARVLSGEGGTIPWHRLEFDAGNLNGDGDATDVHVGYVTPAIALNPTFHNRGGALIVGRGGPGRIAIRYKEADHGVGGTVMNGDGDTLDEVIALLDPPLNALITYVVAALPGTPFREDANRAAYYVPEAAQGAVYNADGDQLDTMLGHFDLSAPGPVAAFTVLAGLQPAPPQVAVTVDGTAAFDVTDAGGGFLAYYIDEAATGGGAILNGDADATDFIPAVYSVTGVLQTIPGPAGLNGNPGARVMVADGTKVFFLAAEEGVDQNGDGDAGADLEVLWWLDVAAPAAAAVLAPGTAIPLRNGISLDGGGNVAELTPGRIAVTAFEAANGIDMNGDLDQFDKILFIVDTTTAVPTVHNTQTMPSATVTMPETGVASSSGVLIRAQEGANGIMNGDGDNVDTLFCWFNFSAPTTRVLLAGAGGDHGAASPTVIGVTANEALGGVDLNLDGDTNDFLFVAYGTNGVRIGDAVLSAQNSVPATDTGSVWAFVRSEIAEARILNGDGDQVDFVLGIWLAP